MRVILTRMPALEAGLARFDNWWSTLSRRERILVATMSVLLAAVVLVYGVIKPLQAARADAIADIRTYETLNARILAAGTLSPAKAPRRQGPPLQIVTDSSAALGLVANIEAMGSGARASFADVNYDGLLGWIADLSATSDLRASRVSIQRGKAPGRVSAVVDFVG